MKILYNFASRSRPERFMQTIRSIINLSENKQDCKILAKLDTDDDSFLGYVNACWEYDQIRFATGTSTSKIHAINRDIPETGWDILVNISDDMTFTVPGFDNIIREHMEHDTFLHFPDNYAGAKLCTMSIMDNAYYQRDGYIYNPAYYSLWCDNEAQRVAELRGRYKYVPHEIVRHDHYSNGGASKDALYRRNDTYHADKLIFEEREKINFGI